MLTIKITFCSLLVVGLVCAERPPKGFSCIVDDEQVKLYNTTKKGFVTNNEANNCTLTEKVLIINVDSKKYTIQLADDSKYWSLPDAMDNTSLNVILDKDIDELIIFDQTVLLSKNFQWIYDENLDKIKPLKLYQNLQLLEYNKAPKDSSATFKNLSRKDDKIIHLLQETKFENDDFLALFYQYKNDDDSQIFYSIFVKFTTPDRCFKKLNSNDKNLKKDEKSQILENLSYSGNCLRMVNVTKGEPKLLEFNKTENLKLIEIQKMSIEIYMQGFGATIFYGNKAESNYFHQN